MAPRRCCARRVGVSRSSSALSATVATRAPRMAALVARTGSWKLEIVKRSDLHRFVVLPRRWIVERTLAWVSRNRRLCRDYERHTRKAAAFVRLAMIRIMLRRCAASLSK